MGIYEILGICATIYFTLTGIASHLYYVYHGWQCKKDRDRKGQMHELEAEKTLMDMRYPVQR